MDLKPENVCERWPASRDLRIPVGAVAYHLVSGNSYGPGSRLKRADHRGELLVCRQQVRLQFKEIEVSLRRGSADPRVYVVWCSLECAPADLAALSAEVPDTQGISFQRLEDEVADNLAEALRDFEGFDLAQPAGRATVQPQLKESISVPPGLRIEQCVLRRVLTSEELQADKTAWAEHRHALMRIADDEKIWSAREKDLLDQQLEEIEKDRRLRSILTEAELGKASRERFSAYMELLSLPGKMATTPCAFTDCRVDLSGAQTFRCGRCDNEMHAWHKSSGNPKLCVRCHAAVRGRWTKGLLALAAMLMVAVCIAAIYASRQGPGLEERARELFDAKDYARAYHAYCRLSDRDLKNVDYHRRIEECAKLGELKKRFLDRYTALVQRRPDSAVVRNYLGNAYLMLDKMDKEGKARAEYATARKLDPDFAPPLNNLAIIAYRHGELSQAEQHFRAYLEACPKDAVGWKNCGWLYLRKVEKDPQDSQAVKDAEDAFTKAIKFQPGLASAHEGLGDLYAATGRKTAALAAYKLSWNLNRDQPRVRQQKELLEWELGKAGPKSLDRMDPRAGKKSTTGPHSRRSSDAGNPK